MNRRLYLIISLVLLAVALGGGALMLSGMSGANMGAAVFAGYLVVVLAVLAVNVLIALAMVLPRRARLGLLAAVVAVGAAALLRTGLHAARVRAQEAKLLASAKAEEDWTETILKLPRAQLVAWLKDGTFDARRPPQVSPSLGLWDRAEGMAQSCQLDAELLSAISGREPFSRDELLNLLEDLRQCPSNQRQKWFEYFCRQHSLLAVDDADQRWLLAQRLLSLDVSGDYLRQFVAAGYRLDDASPSHPPLIFDVLGEDDTMLAHTRALLDLGARRDVKNAEGLTPAAFLERRANGDLPDPWRATLALLR